MLISIEATIKAPIQSVWSAWITPEDIVKWNFASDDWCCPKATIDFKEGGEFSYRMEAKDGSFGFDFDGRFVRIQQHKSVEFVLGDKRKVNITFLETDAGVKVIENFEAEDENSAEMQKQGWQNILNNFKNHVEGTFS